MKTALKTAMMTSISEVIETMFFMSLEFSDNASIETDVIKDTENNIACRIDFSGKFSGYFIFIMPEKLILEMTESFMGLDRNDITEEHSSGTIKEAINMLAGSSLSAFDSTIVFDLSIPEIVDTSEVVSSGKGSEEEITVVTETMEGCMALKAVIESGWE
jgi:chemotaxis protein CheY-P-specific phosphatase CheC